MTIEEIKQLIELANESGVAELEVARGDNRVRIRRQAFQHEIVQTAPPAQAPPAHSTGGAAHAPAPVLQEATQVAVTADPTLLLVKSPIVGTFYGSPSPEAAPFVKVGDHVQAGQILCIIESMKLMNEIEAEVPGTIVARLVESGKPVEYGEAMFSMRPA